MQETVDYCTFEQDHHGLLKSLGKMIESRQERKLTIVFVGMHVVWRRKPAGEP